MAVISKLASLIGEKQSRENRVISVSAVAKETGVPKQTIYNWLNSDVQRFDADIVEAFCKYLECDIGDLLVIVPDAEPS